MRSSLSRILVSVLGNQEVVCFLLQPKWNRQLLGETAGHSIMTLSTGDLYCCLIRQESHRMLSLLAKEVLKPRMLDICSLCNQSIACMNEFGIKTVNRKYVACKSQHAMPFMISHFFYFKEFLREEFLVGCSLFPIQSTWAYSTFYAFLYDSLNYWF